MPQPPEQPLQPRSSSSSAIDYWNQVLDPQNLERAEQPNKLDLETEIAFAQSPDFLCAVQWLEGAAAKPAYIIDLGAGLGANAFALARRGHRVIAVDSSAARLRELKRRAHAAGCAKKIHCIAALAEQLPFNTSTMPAVFTKSVLIHTDLPRAAQELARILKPQGRAALIEPQPGNPFVALYRRTLAPKAWQSITRYFGPHEQKIFSEAIAGQSDSPHCVRPKFLFGFFAFVFQFAWPRPALFRAALKVTEPFDKILFCVRPLRRFAWFGVLTLEKPGDGKKSS